MHEVSRFCMSFVLGACAIAATSSVAFAQDNLSQPEFGVIFEEDVPIRVRDGTVLRADVYRPDAPAGSEFPVLMSMSAYQKSLDRILPHEAPFTHVERPEPDWWTARGYVLVFVDTRGTGTSPGQYGQQTRAGARARSVLSACPITRLRSGTSRACSRRR
jgi:predicted acyl esterase